MTEAFLSFDSPEKKTELKDWGTKNGVKFNKLQKDIATSKAIRIFEDIVAQNTGANSADTVEQMGNIVEILTYYTLNEMFTNNKNEVTARKDAVGIIKNNFQIEDTYYIPKIWDGKKLLDSHIDIVVAKTEIIKDHYLDQWGAVAFGSMKDDTLTIDIQSEFEINMKDNGEWRNTSDGEGLIFGIVLADGEFAPVKNANGDFLEFDFDNDQYILPGTDIKLNMTLNDFVPEPDKSASLETEKKIMLASSDKNFKFSMKQSESSGNYMVVNSEGYMGAYQFGNARLTDFKNSTGKDFTKQEFLENQELQDEVFDWHTNDIVSYVNSKGLDKYIGTEINGVLVTLNGLVAVAHLGGKSGMSKFLKTDGKYNPADSNGTTLTNYLNKFKLTE
jgi:hypothetical protein